MIPETMKVFCYYEFGSPDVLRYEDWPVPRPCDDEVLVRMFAYGFAPHDSKTRQGWYHERNLYTYPFPHIPGMNAGGTVVSKGKDVKRFEVGDRILALQDKVLGGVAAEYCVFKEDYCGHAPEKFDFATACAMTGATLTALQVLTEDADLKAGQRLLVVGAAGAVGRFAVQIGKHIGAYVIACDVEECLEDMKKNGADEAFAAGSRPIAKMVDEKVDMIFSVVHISEQDLRDYVSQIKKGGCCVSTLPVAGKKYTGPDYDGKKGIQSVPLHKELEAETGVKLTWMTVLRQGKNLDRIAKWFDEGVLHSVSDRQVPFRDFKQANIDYEAGGLRGRTCILIENHT